MNRSSSFWFGWPKEELSATERARQSARRESRLEQHLLHAHNESATTLRPGSNRPPPLRMEQRDPLELKGGVDVQVLPESAYGRLFTSDAYSEDVDD